MAQLVILRPWFLLLLPIVIFMLWRGGKAAVKSGWQDVLDAQLYEYAFNKLVSSSNRALWVIFTLSLYIAILGVGVISDNETGFRANEGWVIAIDASESMSDALEVGTLKIDRAKSIAKEIIKVANPRPVALVVYSADAYFLAPFNLDYERMIADLNVFELNMMPLSGTRPDRVIKATNNLYQQAGLERQQLILISDGVGSAQAVSEPNMPVHAVLIEPQLKAAQRKWLDSVATNIVDHQDFNNGLLRPLSKGLKSGVAWLALNERVIDKSYFAVILCFMVLAWILVRE